jgi:hypothetical protein
MSRAIGPSSSLASAGNPSDTRQSIGDALYSQLSATPMA